MTEYLTTNQGLSQSIVYGIYQDRAGFLWFATRDGLNRYDGYTFTVFRHDPFDSLSLPWNGIESITEDRMGNIWVGSDQGVTMLDRHTSHFSTYVHNAADPRTLSSDLVSCMASDRNGDVWIGTQHGLNRFDPCTGTFIRYFADPDDPDDLVSNDIISMHKDRFGDLWIGTAKGYVHRFDPDCGTFSRFNVGLGPIARVICFGDDRDGNIYATWGSDMMRSRVIVLDRRSGAIVRSIVHPAGTAYSSDRTIIPLGLDSLGGLWINVRMNAGKSGQESSYRRDPALLYRRPLQPGGAPGDARMVGDLRTMLCDRSGIIWVGTTSGIAKLTMKAHPFILYRSDSANPWSLSNDRIRSVLQDRAGTLWVGTDMGLNRLDERTGRWTRYMHDPGDPGSISDNSINTIFEDTDGTLVIGTNNGLNVMDRAAGTFSRPYHFPGPEAEIRGMFIWSFHRDDLGRLWVGTRTQGIFLFDRDRNYLGHIVLDPEDSIRESRAVVWQIHRDRYGDIWVATSMGLMKWMPEAGRLKRYPSLPESEGGLTEKNVCAIMEDSSGTLWFTTYGGGLNRYNRATDSFTSITTRDGLPSNTLYAMLTDDAGKLWISSNIGIILHDPASGRSHVYNAADGLQANEFAFKAWGRLGSGEFLFGGIRGLSRFHPDSLRPSLRTAPVVVTEFRIFDAIARQELADEDTVTLSYDQNFISFEFAALDYVNPAGIRYAYRLAGFNEDWIYCGQRRYASFTNLDPGTYVFMVKGTNSDGIWNPLPLRVVVRVVPPYWMTWWFRTLVAAALLASAAAGIWMRMQRERLRRRSVESQLQALRLQVNPHFIFNALSSVQHLILVGEHDLAVSYLSRFSRLMRAVLENSERMAVSIAEEIEMLQHYLHLESLRFEERFVYSIDIDPGLDVQHLGIPTMLIQPCVENAIRHGLLHKAGQGHLRIAISESGPRIRCVIEDDGIGRRRAAEIRGSSPGHRRSMGIRVTEERLDILNAVLGEKEPLSMAVTDLTDAGGLPCGTRVEIFIPILSPYENNSSFYRRFSGTPPARGDRR